ncbi:FMN-binding negative transcriptional regulator [Telmatospirillum sp.]|uniref:FMN-binding negative transcriptional regulator n=1 Tax=Telmatospirillum sp. TaxID=2079197 RepID=UPI002847836E|nr:FMN-binding negative transcriptional regulator [Telmatospirillum sp.]MDR3439185.1 FMN-binding negative transcriptional regulator [Telmatospirillum sp.]
MLYRPAAFACNDRDDLVDFIRNNPFATMISHGADGPWVSHLPLIYENGQLFGHIARANPQTKTLGNTDVLAIFHGPHAYVSPAWYRSGPAVPTWNYAVVHAVGPAHLLNDDETSQVIDHMASIYENSDQWSFSSLPDDYRSGMLRGIVGLSIAVVRLEGKFKLSQNRTAEDQQLVAERLAEGGVEEQAVSAMMVSRRRDAP